MHRMYISEDPAAAAKDFAYKLQDDWGMGDPACDNGALLLLAVLGEQLVLVAGLGVTAVLPEEGIARILDDVRVDINEGRYGAAVEAAIYKYGLALAAAVPHPGPGPAPAPSPGGGGGGGGWHLHVGLLVEELLAGLAAVAMVGEGLRRWRRRSARAERRFLNCRASVEDIRQDHVASRRGDGVSHSATAHSCAFCLRRCGCGDAAVALTVRRESGDGDGGSGGESDSDAELRRPLTSGAAEEQEAVDDTEMLMLPCGHVFCEPCTVARLDAGSTACPVCCTPIPVHAVPSGSAADGTANAEQGQGQGDLDGVASADGTHAHFTAPSAAAGPTGRGALLQRLRAAWLGGQAERLIGGGGGAGVLRSELEFRLHRLTRLFPEYVTGDMVAAWGCDLRSGRDLDAQQLRALQARDPAAARSSLASGWRAMQPVLLRLQTLRQRGRRVRR